MAFIDRLLPAPVGGGFRMDDYWIWCGSVARDSAGLYHMFAARWPRELPFFSGYLTHSEIVRAVSVTPEGPYRFEEVVLPSRGEQWWDGRITHNPTIHRAGGKWFLFYIGSTYSGPTPCPADYPGGKSPAASECYPNIRIGVVVADTLDGPWQRDDRPILEPRPGKWDSSIVTNPAPCVLSDGRVLLYYRSNTPDGLRIGIASADTPEGPYRRLSDDPVLTLEGANFVEDPFVWWTGDGFEMLAKDMTGGITGEKHAGIHARSDDGISWHLADPPGAYSRRVRWDDGSETVQGALERPQLLLSDGVPTHLFAATADGPGGFRNADSTWNMVIPLSV
jgi:hypothetical protein